MTQVLTKIRKAVATYFEGDGALKLGAAFTIVGILVSVIAFFFARPTEISFSEPLVAATAGVFAGTALTLLFYVVRTVRETGKARDPQGMQVQNVERSNIERNRNLAGADLRRANLRSAKLGALEARQGYDLSYTVLVEVSLDDADLQYANLQYATIVGASLQNARLQHADLTGANLSGADLRHANLEYACLRDAVLVGAKLSHANLSHADLRSANFVGAILREAQVLRIEYDDKTKWPYDFVPPDIRAKLLASVHAERRAGKTLLNMADIEELARSVGESVPDTKRYLMLLTSASGPIVGGTIGSNEGGLLALTLDEVILQ